MTYADAKPTYTPTGEVLIELHVTNAAGGKLRFVVPLEHAEQLAETVALACGEARRVVEAGA